MFTRLAILSLVLVTSAMTPLLRAWADDTADNATDDEDEVQSKDPAKQVQNLIFYPHKNEYRLNPRLVSQLGYTNKTFDSAGDKISQDTQSYYDVAVGFAYGLTERWRVGLSETDLFNKTTSTSVLATGKQTDTYADGPSDPTLNSSYRLVQNYRRGIFADVTVLVTPQVAQKEAATASQDGNNFAGGWAASLALPVYFHRSQNEIGIVPTLARSFGATSYNATTAGSSRTTPYDSFTLLATDRFHFNRNFFLGGGVQYNFSYSYENIGLGPAAVTTTHNPDGNLITSLSAGYLEDIHTLLMLTLTYNQANGGTDTTTTQTQQSTADIDVYMYY